MIDLILIFDQDFPWLKYAYSKLRPQKVLKLDFKTHTQPGCSLEHSSVFNG